ncbi:MAG: hypothetical protein B5M52_01860 [Helicobacteraceae bacterium 4484_230]|nr:MAG: hypothetical protein B5M52_01860 [Helicobacteraceae bacterium 4484_230]
MKPIGYLVLINNAFPDTIAFDKEDSIEIAKRFNPKAVKYVSRTYTERRSASELARMLAFDNNETREEILERVRNELNHHWERLSLI